MENEQTVELSLLQFQEKKLSKHHDTCVILHLYYPEMWDEIRSYLSNLAGNFDLFVTIPYEVSISEAALKADFPHAQIFRCENRGRDIAPFLIVYSAIAGFDYRYICKVHTKKSLHISNGKQWQQDMMDKLLGSSEIIARIKQAFDEHPDWGLIAPQGHVVPSTYFWKNNADNVLRVADSLGIPTDDIQFSFVAGSMFWFRPQALHLLLNTNILTQDFEPEQNQQDGALAHAFERLFGMISNYAGYKIAESDAQQIRLADISFHFYLLTQEFRKQDESMHAMSAHAIKQEDAIRNLIEQVRGKEQTIVQKEQTITQREQTILQKEQTILQKEQVIQGLTTELSVIKSSTAWSIALRITRMGIILFPHGTKRGQVVHQLIQRIRYWRSRRRAVDQAHEARKLDPKAKISFKKTAIKKTMQVAYLLNQRLPLSQSSRQKLQRFLYKLLPGFFQTYKQTVNEMTHSGFPQKAWDRNHQVYSSEGFRLQGEKSDLAFWSFLLQTDEAALKLLLTPPAWQVERSDKLLETGDQARQAIETSPTKALFNIVLFVNRVPAHFLNHCIQSIKNQTYKNWRLEIYVRRDNLWNASVLAIQFENEPRIHVQDIDREGNILDGWKAAAQEPIGEYIILLSPYDELKPVALYQAAKEIAESQSDLLYCPADLSTNVIHRELASHDSWSKSLFRDEVAFSQFIVWKKTYLESLFPDHFISLTDDLDFIYNEFTKNRRPQQVKILHVSCYSFREIPARASITLVAQDGNLDLVTSSVPLQVVVDARLIGRQITGTERYVWELLKELSLLRQEYNLDLRAITSTDLKEQITGVNFIAAHHLETIRGSHIFHKTFPASDGRTLAEMALAHTVVYTPLDLILYTNPDYFFGEISYYNYRNIMQLAAKLSDQIISISNYGKREIETLLDIPANRINPVYLGVRPEHFSPRNQEDKDKLTPFKVPANYFLYIGTDYPHKNLVTLLRAFKLARQKMPMVHLVLVGAQYYKHPQPDLDDLLIQLSDHILHLGHVPDDILPSLYHHACALVYPSLHEGFGLPILEAMLCGTPVIASDATSIPEVSGRQAALLVDGRDEQQIAEAMARIWESPEERRRLVMAGSENAAKFSWTVTARQTVESYQAAIFEALHTPPTKRVNERLNILNQLQAHPPTILIVTHIRFYPPTAGNEQRLLRLVKFLKKLGYQIIMLVNPFLEKTQLDRASRSIMHQYVDYYEEIGDVPIDPGSELMFDNSIGNEHILENWRLTEESFCPDKMLQRASILIEQFSPKIIIAEYIWTSRVFALAKSDTLKVIDTIDMFSRKKESVVKFGIQDTLAITPAEELAFFNRSDVIIAIQDSEADAFRKLAPSGKVITAGIDFDVDQLFEKPKIDVSSPILLIVGSGNQINVHCIGEFIDQVWPVIHTRVPVCRLRIIGKVCNSLTTNDPSIELIPYVRDLDAAYREAAVVVNPVYAGTGIKVKSAEALGHGKAFVCWPEGAAGLSSEASDPFLIIHSWEELADAATNLLNFPEKRQELEQAAWEFAKGTLSDKVIYREISDCFDTFSKRGLNILCLFLRYGINDHPQGLSDLQDWCEKKLSRANVTTWVIDNKIEGDVDGIDLDTDLRFLSGDNQHREFSAFQKILSQHRKEIEKYDVIHFVTSAFNTLFTDYLDYFQEEHLVAVAHRPICLGHIDAYDKPIQIAGETSQSWIRTCFFFMSPETAYSVPSFVSFQDESRFFDADGKFLNPGDLSENYQQYIADWLAGEAIQGVSWHSKIPEIQSFMGKTLAILNEHMLSVQLRKAGKRLVDYYWLKDHSHKLHSTIDYPIPDSLEQVKFRQIHLFGKVQREPVL